MPTPFFTALIDIHVGLFSKLSLWSFKVMNNRCRLCCYIRSYSFKFFAIFFASAFILFGENLSIFVEDFF